MRSILAARVLWAASLMLAIASATLRADQAEDEAQIRANCEKYVGLYNRRAAKEMAEMWSPDAVYSETASGESVIGREAIAKQLDEVFAGSEDAKLKVTIDSIDFVSPNVAIEKGTAEVSYAKHPTELTDYTAVHVRRDGRWLLDRVTDTDIDPKEAEPPPSNYEHLKQLEWMVGSWIDVGDNATITTDCEWTKNRNYLTRSFAMVVGDQVKTSGMQVIGWDPVNKQIRSWVFDSDGAFSEGTWTRKNDKWLIQQKGTLVDGGQTTSLNIIKQLDDNAFTWQSINRTVDGEMMPNIDEVVITRQGEDSGEATRPAAEIEAKPAAAEKVSTQAPAKSSSNTSDKNKK